MIGTSIIGNCRAGSGPADPNTPRIVSNIPLLSVIARPPSMNAYIAKDSPSQHHQPPLALNGCLVPARRPSSCSAGRGQEVASASAAERSRPRSQPVTLETADCTQWLISFSYSARTSFASLRERHHPSESKVSYRLGRLIITIRPRVIPARILRALVECDLLVTRITECTRCRSKKRVRWTISLRVLLARSATCRTTDRGTLILSRII